MLVDRNTPSTLKECILDRQTRAYKNQVVMERRIQVLLKRAINRAGSAIKCLSGGPRQGPPIGMPLSEIPETLMDVVMKQTHEACTIHEICSLDWCVFVCVNRWIDRIEI